MLFWKKEYYNSVSFPSGYERVPIIWFRENTACGDLGEWWHLIEAPTLPLYDVAAGSYLQKMPKLARATSMNKFHHGNKGRIKT